MNYSMTALNEKINTSMKSKSKFLTLDLLKKGSVIFLLTSVTLTMKYHLGIVFIIPLLAFVLGYDKKSGYILSGTIALFAILIDMKESLSILLSILLLLTFISEKHSKKLNYGALILISMLSYGVNVFLEITSLNLFMFLFIFIYVHIFYMIFNKCLEIKAYNGLSGRNLFTEEIVALLAVAINLLIGLYTLNITMINMGYVLTLTLIMILGIISSPIYTLGFTVLVYLLLQYTNLTFVGAEAIPFVGFIASVLPKGQIRTKTLFFYLLTPLLFYFNLIYGDVLFILINISIATKIHYFMGDYLLNKYGGLLENRNNESNLSNLYIENFKEDISRRLLNFAEIFETFANKSTESNNDLQKIDEAINEVVDKHCKNCLKKELCLNTNYIKTYNYFTQILKEGNQVLDDSRKRFIELFNMYCLNSYDIINSAIYLNEEYLLNNSKTESLVYKSQLYGLSKIIQNYALELNNNYENENIRILHLKDRLIKLGISIRFIKINNINAYNLNLDLGLDSKEDIQDKKIKGIIEDIFNEDVDVIQQKSKGSILKFKVLSRQNVDIEFGTSYIGKDGSRICGDNFIKCDNNKGNTIVALSDGMGNGYSAHIESKSTLELLSKMLDTGADDEMSVSVINTLVSLKEFNERFSTLDYLVVNKNQRSADFYKIGSAPSFIIRGNKVIRINNDNLPVGATESIDKVTIDLEYDDIIILVSDGVVERFNNISKFESILMELARTSSIQMAHDIIRVAIKEFDGKIVDDMTAIVLKVGKNTKKFVA